MRSIYVCRCTMNIEDTSQRSERRVAGDDEGSRWCSSDSERSSFQLRRLPASLSSLSLYSSAGTPQEGPCTSSLTKVLTPEGDHHHKITSQSSMFTTITL